MTDRKETWTWIDRILNSTPAGGTLYLSRPRQKVRAGHAWPWPDVSGNRDLEIEALRMRLMAISGEWVLSFVKDGDKMEAATRWPWPAESGLFTAQQQAEQAAEAASNPLNYTTELDPFATLAVAPGPPTGETHAEQSPQPQTTAMVPVTLCEEDIDAIPVSLFECHWPGVGSFTFTRDQRAVFDLLAKLYINTNSPEIEEGELLKRAGATAESLDELFSNIKMWKALVIRNQRHGTIRIRPVPMGELPGEFE